MRALIAVIVVILGIAPACAQRVSYSAPDPFALKQVPGSPANQQRAGVTIRPYSINTGIRNLVILAAGQSNGENVNPTLYTPTNSSVIDNINIFDGAAYAISGPLLGTVTADPQSTYGPGNVNARIADLLVTNNKFDHVYLVPMAVGGTKISDWAPGGILEDYLCVAMRRLASRGITPATAGFTFALVWLQGEADATQGTSSASWQASWAAMWAKLLGCGFTGRAFVAKETWQAGVTSATIQGAQAAVLNGSTIFAGGDMDSLNASNRQADNTHLNNTGAASFATLQVNAMAASGAPF